MADDYIYNVVIPKITSGTLIIFRGQSGLKLFLQFPSPMSEVIFIRKFSNEKGNPQGSCQRTATLTSQYASILPV